MSLATLDISLDCKACFLIRRFICIDNLAAKSVVLYHERQKGDKITSPGLDVCLVSPMTARWIGFYRPMRYLPFRSADRRPSRLKDLAMALILSFSPSNGERNWSTPPAALTRIHSSGCCAGEDPRIVHKKASIIVSTIM